MNLFEALERARATLVNLPWLPQVLSPLNPGLPWSELRKGNYETPHYFHSAIFRALFPVYAPFRGVPHLPSEVPDDTRSLSLDNEAWYFLNGICTDRNVLRLNGLALANLFGRRIYLMHNPSDGILLDLLECAAGRTMQIMSTLETSVSRLLEQGLREHSKVVLLVHSQGGIIATGAVYQLMERLSGDDSPLLEKLEIYTFASAATEMRLKGIYAEHFYHTNDYVARIGIAGTPGRFTGRHFRHRASGHLFNTHYLHSFCQGRFTCSDGHGSRLTGYLAANKRSRQPATRARRRLATV
ncbi:hypothetical protein [Marinobacter sp. OP 3.4]|uniref:hypothetical protein n=1 Tax=Marinobacter sp. OP 3.4 TaxID=3076501 RepID=UPI002E209F73